jgi:polyhydroxyalkanoate synthesis regulator phasin
MEELKKLTKQMVEMIDNGDLMGCYSLFEAEIREKLSSLDQESELVQGWVQQGKLVDEEDWAAVMENMENIRKSLDA